MIKKKPILVLKVKIKGEVYNRVYGIQDIKNVIALFNDIHQPGMKVEIIEIEEEK